MWQGLLKENGVPSIYIDAFQNDYTEDAFILIASAIIRKGTDLFMLQRHWPKNKFVLFLGQIHRNN